MAKRLIYIPSHVARGMMQRIGLGAIAPAPDVRPHPLRYRDPMQFYDEQHIPPPPPQPQPPERPAPYSAALYVPSAPPWTRAGKPADAEEFDPCPYVNLTAPVSTVAVLTFVCPPGRDGVIELFGNQDFGAGWTQGTNDLVWQILRNGAVVQNYDNIRASLGNVSNPVALGLRIFEGDTIVVQVINNAIPVVGAGPIVAARFHGWHYSSAQSAPGWRD